MALHDFVGTFGVILILVAYLLLQLERLPSTSLWYSGLNAMGALALLVSLSFDMNLSAFIIELFWLLISLFGIYGHWRAPQESSAD